MEKTKEKTEEAKKDDGIYQENLTYIENDLFLDNKERVFLVDRAYKVLIPLKVELNPTLDDDM